MFSFSSYPTVLVYFHKDILKANAKAVKSVSSSVGERIFFYNDDVDDYLDWQAYRDEEIIVVLSFRGNLQMSTFFEITSEHGKLKIPGTESYKDVSPKKVIFATDTPFLSWWNHTYHDTRTALYDKIKKGYYEL